MGTLKRVRVVVRILTALSMALSLLAALSVPAAAAPNPSGGEPAEWDGDTIPPIFGNSIAEVYFPAVGNADESTKLGAAQTSITVQNIDDDDAYIFVFVGMPEDDDGIDLDNWDVVEYAYLSAGASKTFQASDLEIPAGEVRPVVVSGYNDIEADGDDIDLEGVALAGVAKQAVTGDQLPYTMTSDSAVSGYNAITGLEMDIFDQLYFPIVQTNCGPGGCWNSILRIANMGWDDNAAVTVRFFPADDGSGSLQTGFQLQDTVDVGETWSIDLSKWVPAGWVGSAHVYTDDAVGAIVDRVKPGTDMWITNTASNATAESEYQVPGAGAYPYVLFAPDVRTDYNGWNTGINVANTVEEDTDVSIQYFGANGNAPAAQTRRLAAHGMTYFYNPSDPTEDRCDQPATDVPGCEFIGGAIILSSNPVAAAVDGVKYFGNDANVGQAFSYAATGNAYDNLQAALVQKGNPANGMGATSGLNFLNPNAEAATVETTWLNPSGFEAENFGSSIVWVPGYATGFVYTMFHHNLPNGYVGSAWVNSTLPVVATTANVDYQVGGDGTAIWNVTNPCGLFRQSGECIYESPVQPLPTTATLTQEVFVDNPFIADEEIDVPSLEAVERTPLAGVLVTYSGVDDNGFPVTGNGYTGADGRVTFAVPAGVYDLTLTTLPPAPAGYVYTGDMTTEGVEVAANSAKTVTTILTLAIAEGTGRLTKQITNLPEEYTSFESAVYFCPAVDQGPGNFEACVAAAVVAAGYGEEGNADDTVSAEVPAGVYTICYDVFVWNDADADGEDEAGTESISSIDCEWNYTNTDGELVPIIVLDGGITTVVNDFDAQSEGILNVYVRNDETDEPIQGAEVCIYDGETNEQLNCNVTTLSGDYIQYLPAGTYRVAVTAEGFESESTVTVYSPAADLSDGDTNDLGMDAEVVISLDPAPIQVLIAAFMDTEPLEGASISVHEAVAPDSIAKEIPGCEGAVIASGNTDENGEFETNLNPGTYCVMAQEKGTNEGTLTQHITVPNGSGEPYDVVFNFTEYTGCESSSISNEAQAIINEEC